MRTKVTKDGFVWLEVSARHANDIWKAKYATLYVLHDDALIDELQKGGEQ